MKRKIVFGSLILCVLFVACTNENANITQMETPSVQVKPKSELPIPPQEIAAFLIARDGRYYLDIEALSEKSQRIMGSAGLNDSPMNYVKYSGGKEVLAHVAQISMQCVPFVDRGYAGSAVGVYFDFEPNDNGDDYYYAAYLFDYLLEVTYGLPSETIARSFFVISEEDAIRWAELAAQVSYY